MPHKPGVVDASLAPITDESEIYSGMWGRVSMTAFIYDYKGTKGVSFGLNNVMKTRDDEPFGGASSAASDFGEFMTTISPTTT